MDPFFALLQSGLAEFPFSPPAPMVQLDDISTVVDVTPANVASLETCSICLQNYEEGEKARILPCFHKFHDDCIQGWVREKASCCLCQVHLSSCSRR